MQDGNPTAESGGASTLDRIGAYLAAEDAPKQPEEQEQLDLEPAAEQEAKAPAEADPVVETSDDPPEGAEESLVTLSDFAKYLGVDEKLLDVDDDGVVTVKTKIDGQEGKAKLQDLLKTHQLSGHVDNESRAIAEQRKALQAERQAAQDQARQQAEYLANLTQQAQTELLAEYNQIDWASLSRNDPAEYVAKQHEFQQRNARITDLSQRAQAEIEQHNQRREQELQTFREQEAKRLTSEFVPEWADSKVFEKGKAELLEWGVKSGIPKQMMQSFLHAPVIAALRKAMLYDQSKEAAQVAEKKVRLAPKLVKAGQATDLRDRQAQKLDGIKSQIRKSGGKQGIADYLLASGKV